MTRRLSVGDYHVGPYCGESIFRLKSWTFWLKKYGFIRKVNEGFSVGPILFWKERIND